MFFLAGGLALAVALAYGLHVRQRHVPNAEARISLSCHAVGESDSFIYGVSVVSFCPRPLILYLSELSNEAAVSPRGKWLLEESQPLIFLFLSEGNLSGRALLPT